jgi:hypothetical protein
MVGEGVWLGLTVAVGLAVFDGSIVSVGVRGSSVMVGKLVFRNVGRAVAGLASTAFGAF